MEINRSRGVRIGVENTVMRIYAAIIAALRKLGSGLYNSGRQQRLPVAGINISSISHSETSQ
ncbi:MAG: hypothetical protein QGF90_18780 [Gammaproteobacteria bacterium]|nr:hypothetical protein [Gammaproteobacteria bacterium]